MTVKIMTQMAQEHQAGSQNRSAEVIVVGAGVSGLQTAHKLQQAGISCIVLEGSGNIGGQTFAHSTFNAVHHPRMYAVATECEIIDEHLPIRGKAMLEGFDAFEHDGQPAVSATQVLFFVLLHPCVQKTHLAIGLAYCGRCCQPLPDPGYSRHPLEAIGNLGTKHDCRRTRLIIRRDSHRRQPGQYVDAHNFWSLFQQC